MVVTRCSSYNIEQQLQFVVSTIQTVSYNPQQLQSRIVTIYNSYNLQQQSQPIVVTIQTGSYNLQQLQSRLGRKARQQIASRQQRAIVASGQQESADGRIGTHGKVLAHAWTSAASGASSPWLHAPAKQHITLLPTTITLPQCRGASQLWSKTKTKPRQSKRNET